MGQEKKTPTNYVSSLAISQYERHEKEASYYFQILGWLAQHETTFWNWSDAEIHHDIAKLAADTGLFRGLNVTGMFPSISAKMHQMMRRCYTRGFIFGMRRSTSEMGLPLPLDFLNPQKSAGMPDIPWGEVRELTEEDFAE